MCFSKKCNWCNVRKPQVIEFKGYNKYMNMCMCEECFIKKYHNSDIIKFQNIKFKKN